jgi:hypothetical protein
MKTLYEINWHYKNDVFSHATVTPITIMREGILPGCSAPSITAIGADGRTFQGVARNYFETEAEAWAEVERDLRGSITANENEIASLQRENEAMLRFLMGGQPATGEIA